MRRAAVGIALLLLAGCAATAPAPPLPKVRWPAEDPRYELRKVLASSSDVTPRRSFADWLTGRPPRPLFERPHAVAWSGTVLFVTDTARGRVSRISDQEVRSTPDATFAAPVGIAACGDRLLVADSAAGTVWELDAGLERNPRALASGFDRPTGVGCPSAGELLVLETDAARVTRIAADGTRTTFGSRGTGPGAFNFPTALAVTPTGFWVGDTLNFRVQLFARDGTFVRAFGENGDAPGTMPRLKGLAVDPDSRVWVSDAQTDFVSLYTGDGSLLMSLGGPGDSPGHFQHPAGIAVSATGLVAIADSLNRRVQVLAPLAREVKSNVP